MSKTTLGILALTAPGAASFYQHLMAKALASNDSGENPEIVLYQPNAKAFIDDVGTKSWPSLTARLLEAIEHLQHLGAERVAIPVNTVHLVIDKVIAETTVEVINLLDVVVNYLNETGFKRVLVLGTYQTMTELYHKPLGLKQIEQVRLDEGAMHGIHDEIHHHLVPMKSLDKAKARLQKIVKPYVGKCDVLLKACTELHLAFDEEFEGVPCVDTTEVLAEAMLNTPANR